VDLFSFSSCSCLALSSFVLVLFVSSRLIFFSCLVLFSFSPCLVLVLGLVLACHCLIVCGLGLLLLHLCVLSYLVLSDLVLFCLVWPCLVLVLGLSLQERNL
jgi:hypothetical protein